MVLITRRALRHLSSVLHRRQDCTRPRSDAAQLKSDAGGSERLQGTAGAALRSGWRQKCEH